VYINKIFKDYVLYVGTKPEIQDVFFKLYYSDRSNYSIYLFGDLSNLYVPKKFNKGLVFPIKPYHIKKESNLKSGVFMYIHCIKKYTFVTKLNLSVV
jgi:hypothetical protein